MDKSGMPCRNQAMRNVRPYGKVIVVENSEENARRIKDMDLATQVIVADATKVVDEHLLLHGDQLYQSSPGSRRRGKNINLIVENGYAKGHAGLTRNMIRESAEIRELFENIVREINIRYRIKTTGRKRERGYKI